MMNRDSPQGRKVTDAPLVVIIREGRGTVSKEEYGFPLWAEPGGPEDREAAGVDPAASAAAGNDGAAAAA